MTSTPARSRRSPARARLRPRRWPSSSRSSSRRAPPGSWSRPATSRTRSTSSPALMASGDAIIDGGNSYYRDDIDRAAAARRRRASTTSTSAPAAASSGSIAGFCLMIGGPDEAVERLDPIFATIAPGVDAAERTPGRERRSDRRRAGVPALRAERRRPLREDGPQRHRVRGDGRLRGGPERDRERRHRRPRARDRRRDDAAPRPAVLPLRHRHRRRRRGLAPGLGDRLLAARPDRLGAARVARSWRSSAVASPTPARAAGRCTRRSTRASRRRC